MAMRTPFTGCGTALVTPFTSDGALDEPAITRLARRQVDAGMHFLVPCGTTGESPTLDARERRRVVELVVEAAAGRVPVMAGAGGYDTREVIHAIGEMAKAGATGILSVSPYYNKPTQEGLYQHYKAINDAVDIPIVIYNIPGRSIVDMSVETMARCFALKNVIGVKDATANLARASQQRLAMGPEFNLLSGEDATALGFMAHGGHGCISVVSNIAPRLCAEFQNACIAGDYKTALVLQDRLMPLHDAMFCEANPGPVKYAASRLGLCQAEMRLPMVPISQASQRIVDAALAHVGLVQARAAE
jgi:4-hydroxy-tetrahydrodipicolinate synthase